MRTRFTKPTQGQGHAVGGGGEATPPEVMPTKTITKPPIKTVTIPQTKVTIKPPAKTITKAPIKTRSKGGGGVSGLISRLTAEQRSIALADVRPGEVLTVLAFAGTGKTTCLRAYAQARPHLRILYLTVRVTGVLKMRCIS